MLCEPGQVSPPRATDQTVILHRRKDGDTIFDGFLELCDSRLCQQDVALQLERDMNKRDTLRYMTEEQLEQEFEVGLFIL